MIQIDDKLISFDVFEKHFCCDLPQCLGACCVHGLSGAPLEPEEIDILKKEIGIIEQFLKPGGIEAVRKQGVAIRDFDGDMVTPLIEGEECAFCIEENGIAMCAIEKAWLQGKVGFRKPISCHLYPIRVKKYSIPAWSNLFFQFFSNSCWKISRNPASYILEMVSLVENHRSIFSLRA